MKEILIWHQGALGDLLLSLPAVYSIKKHFACCRVRLISKSDVAGLIVASGIADEVSSNEKAAYADFFREGPLSFPATAFLRNVEVAFIFMKQEDQTFMKNLCQYVPFCRNIVTVPRQTERVHISAFQLRQLQQIGITSAEMPRLKVAPKAMRGEGPLITIHPGSGGRWKRWGLQGFFDVMDGLGDEGCYRFTIILGPAEREMQEACSRFISSWNMPANLVSDLPLSDIASLVGTSALFIGNDSGITHLASLIGTPLVAVFGPTDPAVWSPVGRNVRIVTTDGPYCPGSPCLEAVKPEEVLKAALKVLQDSRQNEAFT